MTKHSNYRVEAWGLSEIGLDESLLGRSEALFALSNGHIGMRGNLDEGEPTVIPGSYLNGVYELRPLPYAEAGYGYPESGQTIINVTDGKLMRLLVDDEPFDLRYGKLRNHVRRLDFRAGVLKRDCEWVSPAGDAVRVQSTRLVSLTQRAIAAIEYIVEPLDGPLRVVVQSELVANEETPAQSNDPRAAAALDHPLQAEDNLSKVTYASLSHHTKRSGLRIVAAMEHVVEGPEDMQVTSNSDPDTARTTFTAHLQPHEKLRIVKYIGYGWSANRSLPAVRDQVSGAISMAVATGWDELLNEQRAYLDEYWQSADIEIDGDAELQQAIRFNLFQILQNSARAERRALPAKGLTGPGYDGHAFWDSESFLLQALTYVKPSAVADALRWRHAILDQAKERAAQLGIKGAAFPWRTIAGEECSAYWPAGTAAFHVNADIADAVIRYVSATEDLDFERNIGLELLVETARLWRSLGQHDMEGNFRIEGVTGPDEYSAIVDNNVYTNLMAQRNLRGAADAAGRHYDKAAELGITTEEVASWRDAAEAMFIPWDDKLKVHPQSEAFTEHAVWDFEGTPQSKYPLLLHYPYFDLYRKQVVKQADLVAAIQFCPDAFTEEQKRRDFEYYEALTTRDSSLSACSQATVAAQVGHVDLAFDYLAEAALIDVHDIAGNTTDGLHMASAAGSCIALIWGFGGARVDGPVPSFAPRLPDQIGRLLFHLSIRGHALTVRTTSQHTTYLITSTEPLTIKHYDEEILLEPNQAYRIANPKLPRLPRPLQPHGRAPARRFDTHDSMGEPAIVSRDD
jgi:alpha,alpha-trehalose phosphorylase